MNLIVFYVKQIPGATVRGASFGVVCWHKHCKGTGPPSSLCMTTTQFYAPQEKREAWMSAGHRH